VAPFALERFAQNIDGAMRIAVECGRIAGGEENDRKLAATIARTQEIGGAKAVDSACSYRASSRPRLPSSRAAMLQPRSRHEQRRTWSRALSTRRS
jgi:hypothetical protein